MSASSRTLIFYLGVVTALGSLSIDMYLPAFSAIGRDLHAGPGAVQETLAAFFVGTAAGQLVYGPLSDRWGRKGPLLAGLLLYTLASAGCAFAGDVVSLAVWRLLQGLGGCAGMVIARAIVRDRFDEVDSARVYSQMMMVMGIAPILAPLVGGQIVGLGGQHPDSHWRTIFWLLAAFGIACSLLTAKLLTHPSTKARSLPHLPPDTAFRPGSVLRVFAGVLRDPRFLVPTLILSGAQAALFSYITGSPGILIEHFGIAPQHYGFFFGANAAGLIGASQVNRLLLRRFVPREIAGVALAAAAGAGLLLGAAAWSGRGGLPLVAGLFFVLLTAFGFVFSNCAAWALAYQGRHAGSASALMGSLSFTLSALAGSAVAGITRALHGDSLRATALIIALLVGAALTLYRLRGVRLHLHEAAPLAPTAPTVASGN